jgi:hypothetical protein
LGFPGHAKIEQKTALKIMRHKRERKKIDRIRENDRLKISNMITLISNMITMG